MDAYDVDGVFFIFSIPQLLQAFKKLLKEIEYIKFRLDNKKQKEE